MSGALDVLTLAAALGCALNAGVFFAFSAFVMDGLARAAPAEGIAAMKWINRRAPTPPFVLTWLGTGVVSLVVAVWSAVSGGDTRTALAIAGAAVYLVGSIALTFARNVPMNDHLETLDARDPEAASYWRTYVRRWTAWNHVRSAAPLVAATLFMVALTEPA